MTKKELLKNVKYLEISIAQVEYLIDTIVEELDNQEINDVDLKKYILLKTDIGTGLFFLNGGNKEDTIPTIRRLVKKYKQDL